MTLEVQNDTKPLLEGLLMSSRLNNNELHWVTFNSFLSWLLHPQDEGTGVYSSCSKVDI